MIPAIVNAGGEVVALDRRFWSPELYGKAGWEVELHFDQGDEIYPSVWTKGRQHRLCTAAQIADTGLADLDAARLAYQARREERTELRASIVRRQAEALSQALDQKIERALVARQSVGARLVSYLLGNLKNLVPGPWRQMFKRAEHRELEFAQDRDLDIQLLEQVLVHFEPVFGVHHQSPVSENVDAVKASAKRLAAHRLSKGPK